MEPRTLLLHCRDLAGDLTPFAHHALDLGRVDVVYELGAGELLVDLGVERRGNRQPRPGYGRTAASLWALSGSAARSEGVLQPKAWRVSTRKSEKCAVANGGTFHNAG